MATYRRYRRGKKKGAVRKLRKDEVQAFWEERIAEGELVKEEWKREFGVDALEAAYYGHQKPDHWSDKDWFTLNLFFASVKVLQRNICPRELSVKVSLTKTFLVGADQIAAMEGVLRIRKAVLQREVDTLKLWKEGRLAYLNSLWQFGCLKIGYSAEMEMNPNEGSLVFDRSGNVLEGNDGMPLIEGKQRVKSETFFIDQVDPDCIVVDRYCRNDVDKTGTFIAQKIFTSVEKLKNDPMYPKSRTRNLRASALLEAERLKLQRERKYVGALRWETDGVSLPENEIVVLYEIYDLENRQMLTIARGADKLLSDPGSLPPGVKLHPFVFLKFNERRDSFYPIPVLYNWWGPQYEYNLTRNQTAVHRKRFNRKYLYDANKIGPDEVALLQSGEDGTFAKVTASGAVEPLKDASLDSAVYFDTKLLREEFMEISGVGKLQRNMVGAESATEAEIVERRSRESELEEHEVMMDFLGECIDKLHASLEANMTQEGAVKEIGPAGTQWVNFGPEHFDEIAGEVLFSVEVDEASRVTLQVERAQLLQLLEILGRNPMWALDDVVLRAIVEKFPALAGNELLIQRMRNLALAAVRMQMAQTAPNPGQTKKVESTSTGKEAGKSRKVVSK
ncbi:MAG: hypothetical protein ACXQS2_06105 [Methermicoccaceae archaeon]